MNKSLGFALALVAGLALQSASAFAVTYRCQGDEADREFKLNLLVDPKLYEGQPDPGEGCFETPAAVDIGGEHLIGTMSLQHEPNGGDSQFDIIISAKNKDKGSTVLTSLNAGKSPETLAGRAFVTHHEGAKTVLWSKVTCWRSKDQEKTVNYGEKISLKSAKCATKSAE